MGVPGVPRMKRMRKPPTISVSTRWVTISVTDHLSGAGRLRRAAAEWPWINDLIFWAVVAWTFSGSWSPAWPRMRWMYCWGVSVISSAPCAARFIVCNSPRAIIAARRERMKAGGWRHGRGRASNLADDNEIGAGRLPVRKDTWEVETGMGWRRNGEGAGFTIQGVNFALGDSWEGDRLAHARPVFTRRRHGFEGHRRAGFPAVCNNHTESRRAGACAKTRGAGGDRRRTRGARIAFGKFEGGAGRVRAAVPAFCGIALRGAG